MVCYDGSDDVPTTAVPACTCLQDLLQPKSGDLQLRENAGEGVHIPGLKEVLVTRLEDCLELLKLGERNR